MWKFVRRAAASITFGSIAILGMATSANAVPVAYDIDWTGPGGYSMSGEFSFDDADAGDGRIDETELLTLVIDGFLNGSLIGSWNLADGQSPGALAFNFNFDPIAEAFFVGGNSNGLAGQQWNYRGNLGLSFVSGAASQTLSLDDSPLGGIAASQSTLTATRQATTEVPEPASLTLFGAGLAGLGLIARRRKAA